MKEYTFDALLIEDYVSFCALVMILLYNGELTEHDIEEDKRKRREDISGDYRMHFGGTYEFSKKSEYITDRENSIILHIKNSYHIKEVLSSYKETADYWAKWLMPEYMWDLAQLKELNPQGYEGRMKLYYKYEDARSSKGPTLYDLLDLSDITTEKGNTLKIILE